MSDGDKNFVSFDKINAGKHCDYSRQHQQCSFVFVHKTVATLSVCVHAHMLTSESWFSLNDVGKQLKF